MAKSRPSGATSRVLSLHDGEASTGGNYSESLQTVMNGEMKSIPAEHARTMLEKGFDVRASDGNPYHFGKELVLKYESGIRQDGTQKSEGPDVDRMRHLSYAVNALKASDSEIHQQTNGVKQKLFLRRQSQNVATAVYVDSNNNIVMSYIFIHKNKSQVDKFMKKRLHGMDR